MHIFRCAAILGCGLLAGCVLGGASGGWGVHTTSWSESTPDHEPIAGIDDASVTFGTFKNSPAVIVWSDTSGSRASAGYDRASASVRYQIVVVGQNGDVPVDCFTADGKTGTVTIAGQEFDLTHGSLFLIATGASEPQVKQLKRTLPMPGGNDAGEDGPTALKKIAQTDGEIGDFFREAVSQANDG